VLIPKRLRINVYKPCNNLPMKTKPGCGVTNLTTVDMKRNIYQ
jgi:hypothetical protein